MSELLERILASKRREVATAGPEPRPRGVPPRRRDVVAALRRSDAAVRLIAEVKFRSPSAGALSRALSAADRAVAYAEAGAAMVSVLCDAPFFGGSWDDLRAARAALDEAHPDVPVLAKEFVVDVRQLDWAAASGADAVLIIARIAREPDVAALVSAARERGLEPLVEVVDERELQTAFECGASLIGVNARDLDTLQLDGERAARVLSRIPPGPVALYLSGIRGDADIARLSQGRAEAALVGEILMREADPRPLLRRLARAAVASAT